MRERHRRRQAHDAHTVRRKRLAETGKIGGRTWSYRPGEPQDILDKIRHEAQNTTTIHAGAGTEKDAPRRIIQESLPKRGPEKFLNKSPMVNAMHARDNGKRTGKYTVTRPGNPHDPHMKGTTEKPG